MIGGGVSRAGELLLGPAREAAFRQATEAERTKGEVLSRKFGEGLKRAKDDPDPPIRPIDLD